MFRSFAIVIKFQNVDDIFSGNPNLLFIIKKVVIHLKIGGYAQKVTFVGLILQKDSSGGSVNGAKQLVVIGIFNHVRGKIYFQFLYI